MLVLSPVGQLLVPPSIIRRVGGKITSNGKIQVRKFLVRVHCFPHRHVSLLPMFVSARVFLIAQQLFRSSNVPQIRQRQTRTQLGKPTTHSITVSSKKARWRLRLQEQLQRHQDTRVKQARPLGVSRTTPKLGRSTTRKWASVSDSALEISSQLPTWL